MKAVAFIAGLVTCWAAAEEPLELKGIRPGMTYEQLNTAVPGIPCSLAPKVKRCGISGGLKGTPETMNTLAGRSVKLWSMAFTPDMRVAAVMLSLTPADFDAVRLALEEKYGPATTREVPIQNRMGATFKNTVSVWKRGDAVLELEKYGGSLDRMGITLLEPKLADEAFGNDKATAKKAVKDL